MPHVQLKKLPNHFISSEGVVFKIENGREVRLRTYRGRKNKRVYVEVEKKPKELVYLMMEYFNIKYTPNDKLKYTVTEDLRIPVNSIIVKPFTGKTGLSLADEALLFKFKCEFKAASANQRSAEKISPVQVFESLRTHKFFCVYCDTELVAETWHLDHFTSISRGGRNVFENIVPSCNECNVMKGSLDGYQFYTRCVKVTKRCVFAGTGCLESFKPLVDLSG